MATCKICKQPIKQQSDGGWVHDTKKGNMSAAASAHNKAAESSNDPNDYGAKK